MFQEEYIAKRNTIPSVFASEGYDMMLFFGRQLAKNGLHSRTGLICVPTPMITCYRGLIIHKAMITKSFLS